MKLVKQVLLIINTHMTKSKCNIEKVVVKGLNLVTLLAKFTVHLIANFLREIKAKVMRLKHKQKEMFENRVFHLLKRKQKELL